MKTIEQIVAKNIKDRRNALGWSQLELAKNARLSEATINRFEKAKQPPRRKNLEAVAKALGCVREDLERDTLTSPVKVPLSTSDLDEVAELLQLWAIADRGYKDGMLNSLRVNYGAKLKKRGRAGAKE